MLRVKGSSNSKVILFETYNPFSELFGAFALQTPFFGARSIIENQFALLSRIKGKKVDQTSSHLPNKGGKKLSRQRPQAGFGQLLSKPGNLKMM